MKFSNETRINPEAVADSIPVIHGTNYYIDEQGYVSTYTINNEKVFSQQSAELEVSNINQVTEFIYTVNNKLAFKTTDGIFVTDLDATKENYRGGFQGIAGFNETETSFQFISNTSSQSTVKFTGRLNNNKQLEIYIVSTGKWIIPLGEFRVYINNTFYNVNYNSVLPNTFGDTFNVTLVGWTTVNINPTTNYIKDIHIAGNTLYLSCRLNIIGSEPYDWSKVDTGSEAVVWSEDTRLNGCYFVGNPSASYFFMVNYNTSSVYYVDSTDLSIKQEYQHRTPILGAGSVDKFLIALVDKEAVTVLSAYVSLNTWLIKGKVYFKFNQLSAYEDMTNDYLREQVEFTQDIDSIIIKSNQRANMMLYLIGDKILSGCHTEQDIIPGKFQSYLIKNKQLYKYQKVEDNGDYAPIDFSTGELTYNSCIYIGSDLEPDVGGSTALDTEIVFEGKIAIVDGDSLCVESSGDVPISEDLPVRTNQLNPDNWWYLYAKTLRYPVSYTDWFKISMMPTTKIFNINLVQKSNVKGGDK